MLARTWHGAVPAEKADAYYHFLLRTAVPDYRGTAGNAGVFILRREEEGLAHFLLVTLWESWEAVGRFAGPIVERAHYYPEDPDFLVELEPLVTHYEVLEVPAESY